MAAVSPHLRESRVSGLGLGLGLLALVATAAGSGVLLALGEMQALYLCLSLAATVAVLLDFRIGVVLLLVLYPFSASELFPGELMGLRGLNPLNLLVLGTFGSFVLHTRFGQGMRFLPRPLLWLYLLPFAAAGILGSFHAADVHPGFYENEAVDFTGTVGYLRDMVIKPLLMVVVALLLAVAVARSQKPERFLWPVVLSIWIVCLFQIGFVLFTGVSLGELASARSRAFFLAIGLHANDLGRLHLMAYALLLFAWWEARDPRFKLVLFFTLGIISLALLLTFSRGAFVGFMLVNGLFLLWKFNSKTLALALLGMVLVAAFAPDYLYRRVTLGLDSGNLDTVSAGRIETIWEPLVPELFRSPLWGNGVGSVMWSYPMLTEAMLTVVHPHNAYLEALLDAGILGLVLFLAFYWTVFRGFRNLASHPFLSPELRGFFQGATAGLAAFFLTGWAGSSLMPRSEWVLLWVAIGMMYGLQARTQRAGDSQARTPTS